MAAIKHTVKGMYLIKSGCIFPWNRKAIRFIHFWGLDKSIFHIQTQAPGTIILIALILISFSRHLRLELIQDVLYILWNRIERLHPPTEICDDLLHSRKRQGHGPDESEWIQLPPSRVTSDGTFRACMGKEIKNEKRKRLSVFGVSHETIKQVRGKRFLPLNRSSTDIAFFKNSSVSIVMIDRIAYCITCMDLRIMKRRAALLC